MSKKQRISKLLFCSSIAVAFILAPCSSVKAQSSPPAQENDMMGEPMMQNGKSMQEQSRAMMVTQRAAMNARMGKMQEMMMNGSMGMDSMSGRPMMQGMKEQRRAMMADMKTQDAQLTGQITAMNNAPEGQKLDLMATIVTQMSAQRTAMNVRMGKMQEEMMNMPMDKDSMSPDSLQGIKDKSRDVQEEQK
jgi:hypothetical protein